MIKFQTSSFVILHFHWVLPKFLLSSLVNASPYYASQNLLFPRRSQGSFSIWIPVTCLTSTWKITFISKSSAAVPPRLWCFSDSLNLNQGKLTISSFHPGPHRALLHVSVRTSGFFWGSLSLGPIYCNSLISTLRHSETWAFIKSLLSRWMNDKWMGLYYNLGNIFQEEIPNSLSCSQLLRPWAQPNLRQSQSHFYLRAGPQTSILLSSILCSCENHVALGDSGSITRWLSVKGNISENSPWVRRISSLKKVEFLANMIYYQAKDKLKKEG